MTRVYFDLTDVIHFVRRNDRVTGIQRVELNVISEIMRSPGDVTYMGLSTDEQGHQHALDLTFLAHLSEFDPQAFLARTTPPSARRWPDPLLLRKHLDRLKHQKVRRSLTKAGLYAAALLRPDYLVKLGLSADPHAHLRGGWLPPQPVVLQPEDLYVTLGTAWDRPRAMDLARAHRAQGGKVVQMVHDLIPVVRPDLHMGHLRERFSQWLAGTTACTTLYLSVSAHTAKDLRQYLNDRAIYTPIAVTPLAHEFLGHARGGKVTQPDTAAPELQALAGKPFVVCVGSIEGRKNGERLIQAWQHATANAPADETVLVFAGRKGWLCDGFNKALHIANRERERVLVLERCSDHDIAWLYRHARFSVYPSLYEGWGLPVGESMWFDTMCLSSNASSLPEVGGDLARYFSPEDTESMARALTWALSANAELSNRREAIRHAPLRTWRDHAHDVQSALLAHMATG